jgi:hypothetical protein
LVNHFRPILGRYLCLSLLGGHLWCSNYWWIAAVGKPFCALALVILGPVIVHIFFFHVLMAPAGLPLAILVVVLWAILAFRNKQHLAGLFVQRTE